MLKYFHSSYVGLEVGLGLTQIISSFEKSVSVYQSHVFGRNSLKAVSTLSSYSATQLLRGRYIALLVQIQIQSTEFLPKG